MFTNLKEADFDDGGSMLRTEINWTNYSVKIFSKGGDPIEIIKRKVREIILEMSDKGIEGPPYDPFEIARFMGIELSPDHDVPDARTVPLSNTNFMIEYNPNKPRGRLRFSLAHELSHILIPDCADFIRNREKRSNIRGDIWQLELLCNVGASEFLMPIGSFPNLGNEEINIGNLLNLRKEYDVSSEALFLRAIKLTEVPCFAFCAARKEQTAPESSYKVEYKVTSKSWGLKLPRHSVVPSESVVNQCTAVGYRAIGDEVWSRRLGKFHVECVGIPPYPGHRYPRVLGIVTKSKSKKKSATLIKYKIGDATNPKSKKPYIIAHVVNDKAQRWGGRGFAKTLKNRWPDAERDFTKKRRKDLKEFKLGDIHKFSLDDKRQLISLIAQKGYGPSLTPRIRYKALETCLKKLAHVASLNSASVHMPRIGCGQAGGSWSLISELIEDELCAMGIEVIVYDLPPEENIQLFEL